MFPWEVNYTMLFIYFESLFRGRSKMQGLPLNVRCISAALPGNEPSPGAGPLPMITAACLLLTILPTWWDYS